MLARGDLHLAPTIFSPVKNVQEEACVVGRRLKCGPDKLTRRIPNGEPGWPYLAWHSSRLGPGCLSFEELSALTGLPLFTCHLVDILKRSQRGPVQAPCVVETAIGLINTVTTTHGSRCSYSWLLEPPSCLSHRDSDIQWHATGPSVRELDTNPRARHTRDKNSRLWLAAQTNKPP